MTVVNKVWKCFPRWSGSLLSSCSVETERAQEKPRRNSWGRLGWRGALHVTCWPFWGEPTHTYFCNHLAEWKQPVFLCRWFLTLDVHQNHQEVFKHYTNTWVLHPRTWLSIGWGEVATLVFFRITWGNFNTEPWFIATILREEEYPRYVLSLLTKTRGEWKGLCVAKESGSTH